MGVWLSAAGALAFFVGVVMLVRMRRADHAKERGRSSAPRTRRMPPVALLALGVVLLAAGSAVGRSADTAAVSETGESPLSTSLSRSATPSAGTPAPETEDGPTAAELATRGARRPPLQGEGVTGYLTAVIRVNETISEQLDRLTRLLVTARYDDEVWVSEMRATLAAMEDTAAEARMIAPTKQYGEAHAVWLEGIEEYDWAAKNLAVAIEGPDYDLMDECSAGLDVASASFRQSMVLIQQVGTQ